MFFSRFSSEQSSIFSSPATSYADLISFLDPQFPCHTPTVSTCTSVMNLNKASSTSPLISGHTKTSPVLSSSLSVSSSYSYSFLAWDCFYNIKNKSSVTFNASGFNLFSGGGCYFHQTSEIIVWYMGKDYKRGNAINRLINNSICSSCPHSHWISPIPHESHHFTPNMYSIMLLCRKRIREDKSPFYRLCSAQ